MNIIYTIIIPHYNIPELLRRCLWSIPKRDDTQVIVVDDKSSEQNVLKLKDLELEYPNVSFIYSETNGGGGKARNIGLNHVLGKYVLFADADDFFNYCINDILGQYKETNYDVVFFNATYINTDTYLSTNRDPTINILMHNFEKKHDSSELKYMFGEPWCKLIRYDVIKTHHIRFDETPIHNDTKFSYMVGFYTTKIKVDNRGLYCLADRPQSVSKAISNEKMEVRLRVFSEKNRFFEEHEIPFFDDLMLVPFDYYLMSKNWEMLKKCYRIAAEYGFSQTHLSKKLVMYKLKRKMRTIKAKLYQKQ